MKNALKQIFAVNIVQHRRSRVDGAQHNREPVLRLTINTGIGRATLEDHHYYYYVVFYALFMLCQQRLGMPENVHTKVKSREWVNCYNKHHLPVAGYALETPFLDYCYCDEIFISLEVCLAIAFLVCASEFMLNLK